MPAVHLIYIYKSTVLTLQTLEETERGARTSTQSGAQHLRNAMGLAGPEHSHLWRKIHVSY